MARMKERVRVCVCCSGCFICLIIIIIIIICSRQQGCTEGSFPKAAVAADSLTCSNVGRDILRSGGSAVDGAIAALICTSIINPQSMGIGGGVIFTIRESSGKVKIINARERTPERFKPDLLSDCSEKTGVKWIGVPGEIRGYQRAHQLYGHLPWSSLFEPTIRLARAGVQISPLLSRLLFVLNGTNSPLRELFSDPEGNLLKYGDTVRFQKLADTLEKVATHGADEFYTGEIAHALVTDVQAAGGNLSLEDLRSYEVTEADAWSIPLGGATLSFILTVMQGFKPNPASLRGDTRMLTYHRYVEACKFANGLKRFMKDPKFGSEKTKQKAAAIITAGFADQVRMKIWDNMTHDAQYYSVTPHTDSQGTTHVSVLAEDGMAVSVTSSINFIFGSKVLSPRTGILLNNQLADFCGQTDQINPGEQPPSSMSPSILYSPMKKHTLVIGASGGSMITTSVAMTLMNYLWFDKSLKDSIDSPVVFVDGENALKFEPKFDQDVVHNLQRLGHTVKTVPYFYNVVNAVSKHEGECVTAYSDTRKLGKAAGY
ncbi:gamma-glutamyltransferase 5a [Trichomycterus rosablanca]|uniref:gamma-glutamyltransferase 5a n=1 Tax=Trichomycterus rosablanca TaxID=2290929 RepID=UPI002F35CED0